MAVSKEDILETLSNMSVMEVVEVAKPPPKRTNSTLF
jgi:ribosomal protein L7/L12